jgi:ssDNA-binding Zn-finger/Zn-ribbon topoisomerase 1
MTCFRSLPRSRSGPRRPRRVRRLLIPVGMNHTLTSRSKHSGLLLAALLALLVPACQAREAAHDEVANKVDPYVCNPANVHRRPYVGWFAKPDDPPEERACEDAEMRRDNEEIWERMGADAEQKQRAWQVVLAHHAADEADRRARKDGHLDKEEAVTRWLALHDATNASLEAIFGSERWGRIKCANTNFMGGHGRPRCREITKQSRREKTEAALAAIGATVEERLRLASVGSEAAGRHMEGGASAEAIDAWVDAQYDEILGKERAAKLRTAR